MSKSVRRYWIEKRSQTSRRGLEFDLTESDIHWLLFMARINIEDVGVTGYHLARFNDEGGYTRGNCRFVPCHVNWSEKKPLNEEQRRNLSQKGLGNKNAVGSPGNKFGSGKGNTNSVFYKYIIGGITYERMADAVAGTGCGRMTIVNRSRNPNFPDWTRVRVK